MFIKEEKISWENGILPEKNYNREYPAPRPAQAGRRGRGKNKAGILRMVLVGIIVLVLLGLLGAAVIVLREDIFWLFVVLEIAGVSEVLVLVSEKHNPAFTLAWVIIILSLPVFGYFLFLFWGRSGARGIKSGRMRAKIKEGFALLPKNPDISAELGRAFPEQEKLSAYLVKEGFPVYRNTSCKYYPLGELQFADMLRDLQGARGFIFMEYFIVASGQLWDSVHTVLRQKAAEGVEVRLMYDDLGSISVLPPAIKTELEGEGIRVQSFNPVHKHISRLMLNYRNHQKIVVIDGEIAYTGGTNLADEYANLYDRFGHWKDTAVRLAGDAVWGLTVTFLQMWRIEDIGKKEDYEAYRPGGRERPKAEPGFFQPFNDGPVNHPHNPAEAVYRQMAYYSKKYLYIATPYLVIDDALTDALSLAADSGVDVRVITPKKWDKWTVHMVTRANYGKLMQAGIRIYEYTPGFIHAKTVLSDDVHCVTGSINLDYRSLYLDFENGVWICGAPVIQDIRRDMDETIAASEEIFYGDWKARPVPTRLMEFMLKVFAPLL
ncbi:cardiolipin synthase [Clostridia bacterium]|nr:cardiolipin synthase [Clostridia bacterium]